MNITNFAKKLAEKPVFKTRIKSDQVKLPEIAIGYFLAPFCAMFANAIFGAYLNRYYVDVLGWTKFGAFATLLPIVSVIPGRPMSPLLTRTPPNSKPSVGLSLVA